MDKRELTLYEAFYHNANINIDRTAMFYHNRRFSYRHILNKVNALAGALTKMGYLRDDVITVMCPNVPDAIYLIYAINQIGAIIDLLPIDIPYDTVKNLMLKSKSKALFITDKRVKEFLDFQSLGIKLFSVSSVNELGIINRLIYRHKNKNSTKVNDIFDLYYSYSLLKEHDHSYLKDCIYFHSGSVDKEIKTIALSSFAINSLAYSGLDIIGKTSGHNTGTLAAIPLCYSSGLVMAVHSPLILGSYITLMDKIDTNAMVKYIKEDRLHILIGTPRIYESLMRNPHFKDTNLIHLSQAFVFGESINATLIPNFIDRVNEGENKVQLYEGYGINECGSLCSINTINNHKDGSVGKHLPFIKVKAFDRTGTPLKEDEVGELYISGCTLMNGYRNSNLNNNSFFIDKDRNKWIKTGDLGKVDKDGFVYFISRINRVIQINGNFVYPNKIENEIKTLPYIFDCYLKGIEDQKLGNMLKLYVLLDKRYKGTYHNNGINNLIINKFGISLLPKEIIYLDKFPKTLAGKIDESKL